MAPCCIQGCVNRGEKRTKKNSGITYHLFPRDVVKRRKWKEAIRRNNWRPSNASVVCSEHFEKSCFYVTQNGFNRLLDDAIPNINIHIENNVNKHQKHNINSIVPVLPNVAEEKCPKTKQLAEQLHKLVFIYEQQKKKIRNMRQRYRRQELKLKSLDVLYPSDVYRKQNDVKRKEKNKKKTTILNVNVDDMEYIHSDINELKDPLC